MGEPKPSRRIRLTLALAAVAAVWLAGLPWLAERPGFSERRADLAERGVDPAAVFYTDHPRVWGRR